MATVPLMWEAHGGEDVGIYASGPESHMFVGNYEQNYIPVLMAHAAEIGPFSDGKQCDSSASSIFIVNTAILLSVLFSYFCLNA